MVDEINYPIDEDAITRLGYVRVSASQKHDVLAAMHDGVQEHRRNFAQLERSKLKGEAWGASYLCDLADAAAEADEEAGEGYTPFERLVAIAAAADQILVTEDEVANDRALAVRQRDEGQFYDLAVKAAAIRDAEADGDINWVEARWQQFWLGREAANRVKTGVLGIVDDVRKGINPYRASLIDRVVELEEQRRRVHWDGASRTVGAHADVYWEPSAGSERKIIRAELDGSDNLRHQPLGRDDIPEGQYFDRFLMHVDADLAGRIKGLEEEKDELMQDALTVLERQGKEARSVTLADWNVALRAAADGNGADRWESIYSRAAVLDTELSAAVGRKLGEERTAGHFDGAVATLQRALGDYSAVFDPVSTSGVNAAGYQRICSGLQGEIRNLQGDTFALVKVEEKDGWRGKTSPYGLAPGVYQLGVEKVGRGKEAKDVITARDLTTGRSPVKLGKGTFFTPYETSMDDAVATIQSYGGRELVQVHELTRELGIEDEAPSEIFEDLVLRYHSRKFGEEMATRIAYNNSMATALDPPRRSRS